MAPEYLLHGLVSEKVDIFAFGVVLLELISGRDNFDGKPIKDSLGFLLGEASEGGCFEGLRSFMDPNLKDYSLPEALCLSMTPPFFYFSFSIETNLLDSLVIFWVTATQLNV